MQTVRQTRPAAATEILYRCCLLSDEALGAALPPQSGHAAAEALLPQIRAAAMLIAAERHDFSGRSPQTFADEADWFAARILVLLVYVCACAPSTSASAAALSSQPLTAAPPPSPNAVACPLFPQRRF